MGARENQRRFVAELARVARRAVFITTPNRWFPIEFHTQLPLAHWLPKPLFRRLLGADAHGFFAREENLNLLGAGELRRRAPAAAVESTAKVDWIRLLGWRQQPAAAGRKMRQTGAPWTPGRRNSEISRKSQILGVRGGLAFQSSGSCAGAGAQDGAAVGRAQRAAHEAEPSGAQAGFSSA